MIGKRDGCDESAGLEGCPVTAAAGVRLLFKMHNKHSISVINDRPNR